MSLEEVKEFIKIGQDSLEELRKNGNGHRKHHHYPRYYKKMMRQISKEMGRR